jgi:hypothetical protein
MTRRFYFRLGLTVAALSLSGCATLLTPARCEQAAAGLNTAAQIAQVLIARGVEPAKAAKLAAACASAGPVAP